MDRDQMDGDESSRINAEAVSLNQELQLKNALLEQLNAELERSKAALDRQNLLLSDLFKNIPIGVIMVEAPSGKPLIANEAAYRLLGRGIIPDATKDNLEQVFEVYKAGTREPYPPEEMPILIGMSGKSSYVDNLEVVRPDGSSMMIEAFGAPVLDSQGRVWASLVSIIDITDRRRHEQAIKSSYERRRKNDMMNELIKSGPPSNQVVHESARILGMKMLEPFSCLLITIDEYHGKPAIYWQDHLEEYHLLKDSIMDVVDEVDRVSWDSPDGIGVLSFEAMPETASKVEQKKLAEELSEKIVMKFPKVKISIGISTRADNLASLGECYQQASSAVMTGRKVWPHLSIYHYLELGVFTLLASLRDETKITEYIERTLGKLLRYDRKKTETYLNTLEIVLLSDNLKASAEIMGVHYHTLMFRKRRIEAILEVSLDDVADRLAILTALHMMKLRKS